MLNAFDRFHILVSLALAGGYGYWLYTKRQQWRLYYAPLYTLASCLLLALLIDSLVFQRAIIASYYQTEGWISEIRYRVPYYEGEDVPLFLVFIGPLVGLALMLWRLPREGRGGQAVHYLLLLVTVYPWAAIVGFSAVEGNKPRYYEDGSAVPTIGSYAPAH